MVNQTNAFLQGPATEADKLGELKEGVGGKFLEVRLLHTKGDAYNTLKATRCATAASSRCGVLEGEPVPEEGSTTQPLLPAVARRRRRTPRRRPTRRQPRGEAAETPGAPTCCSPTRSPGSTNAVDDAADRLPITHVNQPWCEMCGYTLEEVEGLTKPSSRGPTPTRSWSTS